MNIHLSDKSGKEILTLPVVPDDVEPFTTAYETEYFDTLSGKITLIGERQLRTFSIESFFPVINSLQRAIRSYMKNGSLEDGEEYVKFLQKNEGLPIRLVITDDKKTTLLNMLAEYKYRTKKKPNGDIAYKIEFTEYLENDERT